MDFDASAEVFKALGDPHRLRALQFLATASPECCQNGAGICACDLITHLGLAQPTVSHHMRILVNAGLVNAEKQGRWTHYTLSSAGLLRVGELLTTIQTQVPAPSCSPAISRPTA